MTEFKLSTFVVGLIFVSAVAGAFGFLMVDFATNYGVSYTDNESLDILNKINKLNQSISDYRDDSIGETDTQTDDDDILGTIFKGGHTAIKTVATSADIFQTMAEEGIGRANLGETSNLIRFAIIASVIAIIVIGIVISVVVRMRV